jgi:hypothetical protein
MLPAVPERSRPPARTTQPELARLALSTSATAAAAGLAAGLIEQSVILGIVFAVVGGGVRLAVAAWRKIRFLPVEEIDPVALPEPWRDLVQQTLDARRRFHAAVEAWPPGPLRDRLGSLEPTVNGEVHAVWVAAQQGASLTGGYPAGSKRTTSADLSAELQAVQLERADLPGGNQARHEELDRAERALAAQLQSARQAESTAHSVEDRLRGLIARLDQAVTSVVALTAGPGGAGDAEGAVSAIEGLAQEIAALQAGIGEAAQLPGASASGSQLPGAPSGTGRSSPGAPTPPPRP